MTMRDTAKSSLALLVVALTTVIATMPISATVGQGHGQESGAMAAGSPVREPAGQSTQRGVWTWNTDVVTDTQARGRFLDFVQRKQIPSVYLRADSLLPNETNRLRDFIRQAGEVGMEVELLAGAPEWALSSNHAAARSFVNQAIIFTQDTATDAKPIGLHLRIEPHTLSQWDQDQPGTIAQYLDLLNTIKQELTNRESTLILTVDVPLSFNNVETTYGEEEKPLSQHVLDIVDQATLMYYRDFAQGEDGIIAQAQDEMNYAQNIGKLVSIGVETNNVEPEMVTFFEEGEAAMERELDLVQQHYQANLAFHGFAIHDYIGYRILPGPRVYLPLILR